MFNPTSCLREEPLILQLQQHLGLREGRSSIQSHPGSPDNGPLVLPYLLFPHSSPSLAPGLTVCTASFQCPLPFLAPQAASKNRVGRAEPWELYLSCVVTTLSALGKLNRGCVSVAELSTCFREPSHPSPQPRALWPSHLGGGSWGQPQPQGTLWPACELLVFPYRLWNPSMNPRKKVDLKLIIIGALG